MTLIVFLKIFSAFVFFVILMLRLGILLLLVGTVYNVYSTKSDYFMPVMLLAIITCILWIITWKLKFMEIIINTVKGTGLLFVLLFSILCLFSSVIFLGYANNLSLEGKVGDSFAECIVSFSGNLDKSKIQVEIIEHVTQEGFRYSTSGELTLFGTTTMNALSIKEFLELFPIRIRNNGKWIYRTREKLPAGKVFEFMVEYSSYLRSINKRIFIES